LSTRVDHLVGVHCCGSSSSISYDEYLQSTHIGETEKKKKQKPKLLLLDNEMQIESSFFQAPCCHVMPSCSLHVH